MVGWNRPLDKGRAKPRIISWTRGGGRSHGEARKVTKKTHKIDTVHNRIDKSGSPTLQ